jgi:hypothetical protein
VAPAIVARRIATALRDPGHARRKRMYEPGDYVYPLDLPRRVLCRVEELESIRAAGGFQILKLKPLEGPWEQGVRLVRMDEGVRLVRKWQEPPRHRRTSATPDGIAATPP